MGVFAEIGCDRARFLNDCLILGVAFFTNSSYVGRAPNPHP